MNNQIVKQKIYSKAEKDQEIVKIQIIVKKVNQIKAPEKILMIVGQNLMVKIKRMPGIEEINLIIY